MQWREGPYDLPAPFFLNAGASVQFENTFIAVGGESSTSESNRLYQFDPYNGEGWIERDEKLSTPRKALSSFLVSNDYISCGTFP
jgi:hypothetical protein